MNKAKYPSVSTTLTIGGVELPNRIVFPAWQVNYADTEGRSLVNYWISTRRSQTGAAVRTAEDWIQHQDT